MFDSPRSRDLREGEHERKGQDGDRSGLRDEGGHCGGPSWTRTRVLFQLSEDLNPEESVDVLYGPIYYRMLVGHAPLEGDFADTLADHMPHTSLDVPLALIHWRN